MQTHISQNTWEKENEQRLSKYIIISWNSLNSLSDGQEKSDNLGQLKKIAVSHLETKRIDSYGFDSCIDS